MYTSKKIRAAREAIIGEINKAAEEGREINFEAIPDYKKHDAYLDLGIKRSLKNAERRAQYSVGPVSAESDQKYDLIDACLSTLEKVNPKAYQFLIIQEAIPEAALENEEHFFWESEESDDLFEELVEVINNSPYKPKRLFFGFHPDDPKSLGFWEQSAGIGTNAH
jgi:hypothetical protein